MAEYVHIVIKQGLIDADDVKLWDDSLEASNFTAQELIDAVGELGLRPAHTVTAMALSHRASGSGAG